MRRTFSRIAFWSTLIGYVAVLIWSATVLPERTPSHFGADGTADSWGSRASMLAVWAGIGVFTFGGGWLLATYAARNESLINMPQARKEYWFANEERRAQFRATFRDAMMTFTAMTGGLLVVAMGWTSHVASRGEEDLGPFWVAIVVYLAFTTWWVVDLNRTQRPPD